MPDQQPTEETREGRIRAALQGYVDAWAVSDLDAIVALFTDDAVVEDPYGTPPHQGRAAIRTFFEQGVAAGAKFTLDAPIRASHGDKGALAATVEASGFTIRTIDVMQVDENGLITHMQAFWGPGDLSAPA